MDILALSDRTPTQVEQPWPKGSDGIEFDKEASAQEIQVSPASTDVPEGASQAELRARVEDSLRRAESTLAEVQQRVSKELDALDEQVKSLPARSANNDDSRYVASRTTLNQNNIDQPPSESGDEAEKKEVDDLIRGSKTLDDLLRDVETDLKSVERPR